MTIAAVITLIPTPIESKIVRGVVYKYVYNIALKIAVNEVPAITLMRLAVLFEVI